MNVTNYDQERWWEVRDEQCGYAVGGYLRSLGDALEAAVRHLSRSVMHPTPLTIHEVEGRGGSATLRSIMIVEAKDNTVIIHNPT